MPPSSLGLLQNKNRLSQFLSQLLSCKFPILPKESPGQAVLLPLLLLISCWQWWCSLVIRVESCKYCDYRRVRIWWLLLRYWDDIEIPEHPPHPTPPHTLTDTVVIPGFVGSTDGGLGLWWLDGWMVGRWVGRTITLSKLSRYLSGLGNNWTLKIHKREGAKLKEASGHPGSPYQRFKNATFRTLSQPGRLLSVSDQSILSWIVLTALARLGHGG